ncbi:MAG: ROK family protein [Steroidobacteraceae bacterium]
MNILVIDIGGTHVKILATGHNEKREVESGPTMTPRQMVAAVKKLADDWSYDAIAMGYPGLVIGGRIVREPANLAEGWIGFDFERAFGCPVRIVNDAAMQALGSYRGGTMLFLGLGTGLGSALVVDGHVVPMELAHLPYKKGEIEDYVGLRGLERQGKRKWREHVEHLVGRFTLALHPDEIVIGGGNAKKLKTMPPGCREGDNANAFAGGFRLWESAAPAVVPRRGPPRGKPRGEAPRRRAASGKGR